MFRIPVKLQGMWSCWQFSFDYEPNGTPLRSQSKGILSLRSHSFQFGINQKSSSLSVERRIMALCLFPDDSYIYLYVCVWLFIFFLISEIKTGKKKTFVSNCLFPDVFDIYIYVSEKGRNKQIIWIIRENIEEFISVSHF